MTSRLSSTFTIFHVDAVNSISVVHGYVVNSSKQSRTLGLLFCLYRCIFDGLNFHTQ